MLSVSRFAARFLSALLVCTPLVAQNSGSIYTTDAQGQTVNQNVFDSDRRVYLGGGPGVNNCNGTGLPAGDYYFQVTTTSGGTLLTTDPISNRRVTVGTRGVFSSYAGTRRTGRGPCNSIIIQLYPFSAPPNGSLEYKVWVTPVASYDPALGGAFGFRSSSCKTDNFKIRPNGRALAQTVIRGSKFFDFDGNGVKTALVPEEVPIPGWRFELWKAGVRVGIIFTDENGAFEFIRDQDGSTYEVIEVPPPPGFIPALGARWFPTTSISRTAVANAPLVDVGDYGNLSFGTEPTIGIGRSKGYWHNSGEAELFACDPDWRVAVNGPPGFPICLRRPISSPDPAISIFTVQMPPTSFQDAFQSLADYLTGNPALGHAGFILSSQVCATVLNRACGPFSDYSLIAVDVHDDDHLILLSDLLTGAIGLICDPRAGQTGPGENEDLRARMLGCINEFEQLNSESGGTAHTPTTRPQAFSTPYGGIE